MKRKRERWESKELASLPARVALGTSMVYHGLQKLRAPKQTGQFFENVGVRPGKPWAFAVGLAECTAGVLTLAGIGTRLASGLVLVTQATAINKAHRSKGYDTAKGGFEYNLALMAIATGILIAGPGRVSLRKVVAERVAKRSPLPFVRNREPMGMSMLQ